jgi:DNA-binding response OmpR family regulator
MLSPPRTEASGRRENHDRVKNVRALIIEDETMVAFMLEDHLARLGYHDVRIAATEDEAVAFAWTFRPDLMTVDARLARGCGITAALKIAEWTATPTVFVTGNAAQVRRRVKDPIVVEKPFLYENLATAVMLARSSPGVRTANASA